METAFSGAQALLERTNVQELCKAGQKVVLLEHNQTISDALKSMSKSQILSAPMVRMEGAPGLVRSGLPLVAGSTWPLVVWTAGLHALERSALFDPFVLVSRLSMEDQRETLKVLFLLVKLLGFCGTWH